MKSNSIFLTFDTDWLKDDYLQRTIDLLVEFDVKATFFATNESPLLQSLDPAQFEIGLHPNFNKAGRELDLDALHRLKALFPQAVGTRSHTLLFGSRLLSSCHATGMLYESNIYLHKHLNLHPVPRTKEMISIPFNWSDDKHIELERPFELGELPTLDNPGLNVFNFHPVHIFLNTDVYQRYENAKVHFNQPEMTQFINSGTGMRSLFVALLQTVRSSSLSTLLMRECLNENID